MTEPPKLPIPDDPPSGRRPGAAGEAGASTRRPAPWKVVLLTLLALAAAGTVAATAVVYGGLYNVAATAAHLRPTYAVIETAMERSVRLRARDIAAPRLDAPDLLQHGAACFRDHCVQCHGAPGVAPDDFSKSLQPVPASLIDAARHWRARELYWITRHGIKMSGMPAWEYHLSDREMWGVVAFLTHLPEMSTQAYDEHLSAAAGQQCRAGQGDAAPAGLLVGDPERGQGALREYGCIACHTVPGVTGAQIHVGPPLGGMGQREWIAGRLPNTADNLAAWIREPQRIDPATAMPNMGVTAQHARDMAAYLSTLR